MGGTEDFACYIYHQKHISKLMSVLFNNKSITKALDNAVSHSLSLLNLLFILDLSDNNTFKYTDHDKLSHSLLYSKAILQDNYTLQKSTWFSKFLRKQLLKIVISNYHCFTCKLAEINIKYIKPKKNKWRWMIKNRNKKRKNRERRRRWTWRLHNNNKDKIKSRRKRRR